MNGVKAVAIETVSILKKNRHKARFSYLTAQSFPDTGRRGSGGLGVTCTETDESCESESETEEAGRNVRLNVIKDDIRELFFLFNVLL